MKTTVRTLTAMLCMVVAVLTLSSCKQAQGRAKLQVDIEKANKECPISLGEMGTLTAFKYDAELNQAKIYMTINDQLANLDALEQNSALVSRNMLLALSSGDKDSRELLKELVDAKAGLAIEYKGRQSGKTVTVEISSEEIEKALNNKSTSEESNEELLRNMVELENSSYPQQIEEGLVMKSATIKDGYVTYNCEVDEDVYDMTMLREAQDELKAGIFENFDDVTVQNQLKVMRTQKVGIKYVYQGNRSGEKVTITIEPDEL